METTTTITYRQALDIVKKTVEQHEELFSLRSGKEYSTIKQIAFSKLEELVDKYEKSLNEKEKENE